MPLTSDDLGFLVGKPINEDSVSPVDILKEIKGDTAAIRKAIAQGVRRNSGRVNSSNAKAAAAVAAIGGSERRSAAVVGRMRDEKGRFIASKPSAVKSAVSEVAEKIAKEQVKQEANERKRDAKGRFIGKGKKKSRGGWFGGGDGEDEEKESTLKAIADSVKEGVAGAGEGFEEVDPIIQASKEMVDFKDNVSGVFNVLTGGFFSEERVQARLDKRKERKAAKKEKAENKWQGKVLKRLEEISEARAASGVSGGMMGFLLPLLMTLFTPLTSLFKQGAGFLGGILTNVFSKLLTPHLKAMFAGAAGVLKSVLTKVFLPAAGLLAAGFAGFKLGDWLYEKYGEQFQDSMADAATQSAIDAVKTKRRIAEVDGTLEDNQEALTKWLDVHTGITPEAKQALYESIGSGFLHDDLIQEMSKVTPEEIRAANPSLSLSDAQLLVKRGQPEEIARSMYAGAKFGNTSKGDHFKYRTRGYGKYGLTGKSDYVAASKHFGVDFVNNPDLAASDQYAPDILWWKRNQEMRRQSAATPTMSQPVTNATGGSFNTGNASMNGLNSGGMGNSFTAPVNIPNQVAAQTPVTGNKKDKKPRTPIQLPAVGQNISDRDIAQVVTGGMGNGGNG